uniref:Uncharacterized protein n=1 Tax=Arundo donax TaxID=35708 RepID=A0A0A9CPW1_ARUDO
MTYYFWKQRNEISIRIGLLFVCMLCMTILPLGLIMFQNYNYE